MNTIPTGGRPPRSGIPPWLIAILGCCGGCGLLIVIFIALGAGALFAPKTPPPAAYVGVWQGADNTELAIGNDGVASFRYRHTGKYGNSSASVTGGRVKVDEAKHTLAIKIAGVGETWRIDDPPRETNGTMEMKLNGVDFKREAETSNGLLSGSSSTTSE